MTSSRTARSSDSSHSWLSTTWRYGPDKSCAARSADADSSVSSEGRMTPGRRGWPRVLRRLGGGWAASAAAGASGPAGAAASAAAATVFHGLRDGKEGELKWTVQTRRNCCSSRVARSRRCVLLATGDGRERRLRAAVPPPRRRQRNRFFGLKSSLPAHRYPFVRLVRSRWRAAVSVLAAVLIERELRPSDDFVAFFIHVISRLCAAAVESKAG
jgi:hypothetical protein